MKKQLKVNMFMQEMSEPGRGDRAKGARYHLHREAFLGLMILQLKEESVVDGENKEECALGPLHEGLLMWGWRLVMLD